MRCAVSSRVWVSALYPVVVCDDVVVRRTLVLIALHRSHCFHRILLYGRYSVYMSRR